MGQFANLNHEDQSGEVDYHSSAEIENQFQLQFIHNLDGMRRLEEDWRKLEANCKDPFTYFQSFDWCYNWAQIWLNEDGRSADERLLVAAVWHEGDLVAVLPMAIYNELGVSVLRFLGSPLVQFGNMLADPERFPPEEVWRCMEALDDAAQCDAHVLERFVASSVLGSAMQLTEQFQDQNAKTSMLSLGQYASVNEYMASLGKSTRKGRRRRRNKLEAMGKLNFQVIDSSNPDYNALVDQSIEMKMRWLNETGRRSTNIRDARLSALLKALPGDANSANGAVLMALTLDGKLIASEIGFCHHGHYYSFIGAFDWALYDLSPGKVQIEEGICWAIGKGIKNYDFLGDPVAFKKDWTDQTVELGDYNRGITVKGQVFARVWAPQVMPKVKQLFSKMPTSLRRPLLEIADSLKQG